MTSSWKRGASRSAAARVSCALAFLAGSLQARPVSAQDARPESPDARHRRWLDKEVVYIITDKEREAFLSLDSTEEKEQFIEAFWRRRDPAPATPINEYREEHNRRLEHANRTFGKDAFVPGWRTDRGRMYILLGEPRSAESFDGYSQLVTSELWFYQGDPGKGLPAFFYLLFFKRNDVGEYRFYSPMLDGPGALLRGQAASDPARAVQILHRISPQLARASLAFDASEPVDFLGGTASLGTERVLARIEESPKLAVRTDDLDGWLRYGKHVSAEYSFNFVPSRSTFAVLCGADRVAFLHFALELDFENFPMETDEERFRFYTTVDVSLEVKDRVERVVVADQREAYIELSKSQVESLAGSSFSYQDSFPLVPGDYRVLLILRNRVLHRYTVAEREISVSSFPGDRPALSDVVLGFHTESMERASGMQTFQAGSIRVHPAADGVFALGDTAETLVQVWGGGPGDEVRFSLLGEETTLQQRSARLAGQAECQAAAGSFPLTQMAGGDYSVSVQLIDSLGRVREEKRTSLRVSPRTNVPRPAVSTRRQFDVAEPGLLALTLGDQHWAQNRFDQARLEFEKAVAANNPRLPLARWKLAGAYIRSREPRGALALLRPLESDFPHQYEVVVGLGLSYYLLEDFPRALGYLERAVKIRPPRSSLLNALGDVYLRLGNPAKARQVLERSLEIDPNQTEIQQKLESLKGKHDSQAR